jgi:hypothetical protein
MQCEVEYTDEFSSWWESLNEAEQNSIAAVVIQLQQHGASLTRPQADTIRGSRYSNMRELRVQHQGRPYRVLYAFDPRRKAVLLIGGDKTGDDRWYEKMLPLAEEIYAEHLREISNAESGSGEKNG